MKKIDKKDWDRPWVRVRIPISKVGGAMKSKKRYTRKCKHKGKIDVN